MPTTPSPVAEVSREQDKRNERDMDRIFMKSLRRVAREQHPMFMPGIWRQLYPLLSVARVRTLHGVPDSTGATFLDANGAPVKSPFTAPATALAGLESLATVMHLCGAVDVPTAACTIRPGHILNVLQVGQFITFGMITRACSFRRAPAPLVRDGVDGTPPVWSLLMSADLFTSEQRDAHDAAIHTLARVDLGVVAKSGRAAIPLQYTVSHARGSRLHEKEHTAVVFSTCSLPRHCSSSSFRTPPPSGIVTTRSPTDRRPRARAPDRTSYDRSYLTPPTAPSPTDSRIDRRPRARAPDRLSARRVAFCVCRQGGGAHT